MSKSDNNDQQNRKVIFAPDKIPRYCNPDCQYHSGYWSSLCSFYNQEIKSGGPCIATIRFNIPPGPYKNMLFVCPDCKTEQKHQDAEYCINCGADLFPKKKVKVKKCPTCKTRYEWPDRFCDKDGKELIIMEIEVGDDNPNVEVGKILPDSKDTERVNGNDDNVNVKKPMNWYKFVTYVMCPLGIIISLYLSYIFNEYSENFEALSWFINAGFLGILLYGLHNRTTWSWKLLLGLYIMNGLFGRFEKLDEWGPFPYLIFVIFVMAITTYPNYIYFKKRRHLFQN